jgi:hypothetical protein
MKCDCSWLLLAIWGKVICVPFIFYNSTLIATNIKTKVPNPLLVIVQQKFFIFSKNVLLRAKNFVTQ